MKMNLKPALFVFGGIVAGMAGTQAILAQQTRSSPAYVIAEVESDAARPADPDALRRYAEETPKLIQSFGGRYLIRGGKVQTLEGEAPKGYIVMLQFDSVEKARAWYESPAYAAIRPIRQNSTRSRLLLVEGTAPQ